MRPLSGDELELVSGGFLHPPPIHGGPVHTPPLGLRAVP
jgi:hypothetical protein